jgi:hypothetical protein
MSKDKIRAEIQKGQIKINENIQIFQSLLQNIFFLFTQIIKRTK